MIKTVIYARYSSHKQTEQSIEGQLRICEEYAKNNDLKIIDYYIDKELSGKYDNRENFQKLISDSKNQKFDCVLVYKFDRFARNRYDSIIYKELLKKRGIKTISATEYISEKPEGIIMEAMLEGYAEYYSAELSQKVKRGMKESILKGNTIGGHMLYGYKVVDKKIMVDEQTAPAIKYLFEEYAKGKPKKQIIKELNEKGFRTRKGKLLTISNFQNNLSNIKYVGVYDNGTIQKNDYYPQIIDRKTFDRVQEILKFHKRLGAKQKAKAEFLLTGKAFCGHCGASLVGVSGTSRDGTKHYYYTCSNRWKKHSCKKNNEKKDFLEKYVVGQTLNYILTDENIEKISTAFLDVWNKSDVKIKIDKLQKQIVEIENEIDKCFNSFVLATNEDLQKRLNERAESLTIHKKDLQNEIEKLKFTQELTKSKNDVKNLLHKFLNGNVNDINFQREIIFNFVNCVYVFDDKILIYYNLFDNKNITFDDVLNDLKEQDSHVQIFNNTGSQNDIRSQ